MSDSPERFLEGAELKHLLGDKKGRKSVLLSDFVYIDKRGRKHTAKKGLIIDGGSIPRWAWIIIGSPYTMAVPAYVIHDWYCEKAKKVWHDEDIYQDLRKKADKLFKEMLNTLVRVHGRKIPGWKRSIMYRAVRLGSRIEWTDGDMPDRR